MPPCQGPPQAGSSGWDRPRAPTGAPGRPPEIPPRGRRPPQSWSHHRWSPLGGASGPAGANHLHPAAALPAEQPQPPAHRIRLISRKTAYQSVHQ